MSTTVAPTPTSVGLAAVTMTVTAAPAPELFLNSFTGCLCVFNILFAILSLWMALIVGFTRLSIIPIIVSAGAATGNGLIYLQKRDTARGEVVWRPAAYVIRNIGWTIQHFVATLYAYFMLRYLLPKSRKRMVYIWGFWILFTAGNITNLLGITFTGLGSESNGSAHIRAVENKMPPPSFMTLMALELWSSAFLLYMLYVGRRNAMRVAGGGAGSIVRRESLLKYLAKSTEIRVACIMFVYVIRTCTFWTWFAESSPQRDILYQVDNFAVLLENVYPVLLIIDLIAARMIGSPTYGNRNPAAKRSLVKRVGEGRVPSQSSESSGPSAIRSPPTLDSFRRDFRQYMGRPRLPSFSMRRLSGSVIRTIDEVGTDSQGHDAKEGEKTIVKDVTINQNDIV